MEYILFQSPRSGKVESNQQLLPHLERLDAQLKFQSPRSGKFESNTRLPDFACYHEHCVSIP